jgi:hypothetical protein
VVATLVVVVGTWLTVVVLSAEYGQNPITSSESLKIE